MANTYDKGDLVRCSGVFTDLTDDEVDPGTVIFRAKSPSGVTITYTYGVDPELVKDSVGRYHADVDADQEGVWSYRFESSGTGQAAGEQEFRILKSAF